jgi:Fe-S-cluster containining protein
VSAPEVATNPEVAPELGSFRDELRAVYGALDAEIARLAPVCVASGRCCRFAEYGHTLFVSAVEFAFLLEDGPAPSRELDEGATCPWQDAQLRCTAREVRPIGCRVYFCDPSYEPHASGVSETAIADLKRRVDQHGRPWNYAPLHHHLRIAALEGNFPAPGAAPVTH